MYDMDIPTVTDNLRTGHYDNQMFSWAQLQKKILLDYKKTFIKSMENTKTPTICFGSHVYHIFYYIY